MSEATHSYYDWQVSTLMLAYDVVEPLARDDEQAIGQREQQVQQELYDIVQQTLPPDYLKNPQREFPPEIVSLLTRATLKRATQIVSGN